MIVEFRVLGLLEVTENGRPVAIGRGKEGALIALLLASANRPLSTEKLRDELWSGGPPPVNAAKVVQIYVSRLRRRIGATRILTTSAGYLFRVEEDELDATRFEQLAALGRKKLDEGEHLEAEAVLSNALELWRGEAFADFRLEAFAQTEIGRLEELRRGAVADRLDARIALGQGERHIAELQALVDEQPLWERPRRQLMLALYQAGRQADALELYRSMRLLLAEELGLNPTPELQALERAILNQAPELERPILPPLVTNDESGAVVAQGTGAFVGRERELDELLSGLDDALAGRGRLFLITGEPGIGKSRLTDELGRIAGRRGVTVLAGRCWEAGGAPAYWPWVESLRAHIRETGRDLLEAQLGGGAGDLVAILPELHELFPDLTSTPFIDSDAARFRLFDATSRFLCAISQRHPTVLVLDDLHAADEPSILLLRFLARELGSMRLLVLAAYRDIDPVPAKTLIALQAELTGEPVLRRLSLRGLSREAVGEYLDLSASGAASPELVTALYAETEGNPLFVAEMVRLLNSESKRAGAAPAKLEIPQSVRDVIARRLSHLPEECNRVLALASVLGREFDLDVLGRVAELTNDELAETLDRPLLDRVISDVPGSPARLRFTHVLIRDTLYDGLTSARRVRAHRAALTELENVYGGAPGPHLTELAHHAVAGSEFSKGVLYARRAGDAVLELHAYEAGARLYETALDALDLVPHSEPLERAELLLSLGDAELRAGEGLAAKGAFLRAADIARQTGLSRELARAATGYGGRIMYARVGDDELLIPLLEEGLAGLDDGEVELRALLLARLAGALRDEPDRARRDQLSNDAVALARSTGNPAALAYALDGRAAAVVAPDTLAECLELGQELCRVSAGIGDTARNRHGHWHRITALVVLGALDEAQAELRAMERIADELRQPSELWPVYAAQAMLATAKGRFAEAEMQSAKAYTLGKKAQPEIAVPVHWLQRFTLGDFRGNLEEVASGLSELVAEYPARPAFRCALAHFQAQIGDTAGAQKILSEFASTDFKTLPFDLEWLYGISLLAETAATLRDSESAAQLYPLLLPWASLTAADLPEGFRGSISRYLALLAETTENANDAATHYEHALTENERMGLEPWLARTRYDYARMLASLTSNRNPARARELLGMAHATFHELGMKATAH